MKRMLALRRVLLFFLGSMIFLVAQDAFAASGKDEPKNIPLQGGMGGRYALCYF